MIDKLISLNAWVDNNITINAAEDEVGTRQVRFELLEDGEHINLTDCTVRVYFNDNEEYNECTIENESNGIAYFTITSNMCENIGKFSLEVDIVNLDGSVTKFTGMSLMVFKAPINNAMLASNQYTALDEALGKFNYWNDLFQFKYDEIQTMVGPQGPQGIRGKSNYEVAVENGFTGTEEEWLDSLKCDTAHNAEKVNNHTVKSDVPENAIFTDTTYTFTIGTSTNGWTSDDCDYLCDGTADDVEFNSAITDLPTTGGKIVVLSGTYNIESKIDINKSNVTLQGCGNNTILKRMWDSSMYPISEGVIALTTVTNCIVKNFCINGNKTSYSSPLNSNITLYGDCDKNTITENTSNDTENSIHLYASNENIISNNTCNDNNNGIYTVIGTQNIIANNITKDNETSGICITMSVSNAVTGNVCVRGTGQSSNYTSSQYTILVSDSSDNVISGNVCTGKDAEVNSGNYYDINEINDIKSRLTALE